MVIIIHPLSMQKSSIFKIAAVVAADVYYRPTIQAVAAVS